MRALNDRFNTSGQQFVFVVEVGVAQATAIAAQLSSPAWVVSHLIATFGFVFLLAGLFVVFLYLTGSRVERLAFVGLILCMFGIAMTAAVASLEGIGLRTMGVLHQQGKADVMAGVMLLRFGPSIALFPPGLLLLAAGGVTNALAISRSGMFSRWAGFTLGLGLVFFLPLLPRAVRIADGILIAIGAVGLAADLWRDRGASAPPRGRLPVDSV